MTTLKDISMLSGVSLATVSRVINGNESVDGALKVKVIEAAKQLNYTPNLAARSLRTKNTKLIGMISEGNTNYMFSNLINYISDYCTDLGYGFLIANHHNDPEREEKIFTRMRQRGVDGLILSLVSKNSNIIPDIICSDVPIVIFDRYLLFDRISMGEKNYSITLDNYQAGRMAAEYLLSMGHKRIALAEGPKEVDLTQMRTNGFLDCLADAGVLIPLTFRFHGGFEFENGCAIAEQLLALSSDNWPTAIWCQNDTMAAGLVTMLSRHKIPIPQRLSVLGMDNIELSKMIYPTLSSIEQPYWEMGKESVRMLLGQTTVHGKKAVMHPQIIERESTCRYAFSESNLLV